MTSYREHNVGTAATWCASALDFGPIKRICLLMEITASAAFRAMETNLVFHVLPANCGSDYFLPFPIRSSHRPLLVLVWAGLLKHCSVISSSFQFCIAWGESTLNNQLILLFLLRITLWVYEGLLTATQLLIKMQYAIIMPAVSEIMIHNRWKDSELHLTTLGGN